MCPAAPVPSFTYCWVWHRALATLCHSTLMFKRPGLCTGREICAAVVASKPSRNTTARIRACFVVRIILKFPGHARVLGASAAFIHSSVSQSLLNLYSTCFQSHVLHGESSHMCRVCKVVVKSARSLDGVQQGYQLTGCGQACIRQTVNTQLLEQHLRLSVPSLPFQRSRYHTAYVWSFLRTRVTSCVLRVT